MLCILLSASFLFRVCIVLEKKLKLGVFVDNANLIDKSIEQNILDYSVILETTINDIEVFLSEISRVYGGIGQKFPIIDEEMSNENSRAEALMSYFTEKYDDNERTFSKDLNDNQVDFTDSFDKIKYFIDQDDVLSESIIRDVSKTNNVMESIDKIRLLADQIKVYSLNAIVISSKYGVAGHAFGEISKNIIKLSDLSNNQADSMNKVGNDLFLKFDEFKTKIVDTNNNQKANFIDMQHKIREEHSGIAKSFSVFSKILFDVIGRVSSTYDYVSEIMIILQREDIIRQQTEHVAQAIRILIEENKFFIDAYSTKRKESEGKSSLSDTDKEEVQGLVLDVLTFSDAVLLTILSNLRMIYDEIKESNVAIKKELNILRSTLKSIANDRDLIVEYMIGKSNDKTEYPFIVSNYLFDKYKVLVEGYLDSYKDFLNDKYIISDDNATISDLIEQLEGMFSDTKNIAKTFNSINFLAKIELEKNEAIFSDSRIFSIESVESIASIITDTVEECVVEFNTIKSEIFNSVRNFKSNINQQSDEYLAIEGMTKSIVSRLKNSEDLIRTNSEMFKSYADSLLDLIDETILDLNSLESMLVNVNEIIEISSSIHSLIKEKKQSLYAEIGITSWKIESEKYLSIMNSYTIEKERAIMNDVLSGGGNEDVLDAYVGNNDDVTIF